MGRDEQGEPGSQLWPHRDAVGRCSQGGSCQELLAVGASAECQSQGFILGSQPDVPNRLSNWPFGIWVSQGELLSQFHGINFLGSKNKITTSKSSLSLTNTIVPDNVEKLVAFSLASVKPDLGRALAGSPGTAQGTAEQDTCQHPKKSIHLLQWAVVLGKGLEHESFEEQLRELAGEEEA